MLMCGDEVLKLTIEATDGEIGSLKDILLEDDSHELRWLVVDVGNWLFGRKVLLPPGLCTFDADSGALRCSLDKEHIESGPVLEHDLPVSRQFERNLIDHYGYWSSMTGQAGAPTPTALPGEGWAEDPGWVPGSSYSPVSAHQTHQTTPEEIDKIDDTGAAGDPHLRSCKELQDYRIQATDDRIGHIEDMIFDLSSWRLRYFVVNTRNWLPGGDRLLLSPAWFKDFDYHGQQAYVDIRVEDIKGCPPYEPDAYGAPKPEHEEALHRHLEREPYW